MLGDGSFGKVYKASLQGQTVAAKLFLPGCDVPIYKRMRQEVRGQSLPWLHYYRGSGGIHVQWRSW